MRLRLTVRVTAREILQRRTFCDNLSSTLENLNSRLLRISQLSTTQRTKIIMMRLINNLNANRARLLNISSSSMITNIGIQDMLELILTARTTNGFNHRAARNLTNDISSRPITLCDFQFHNVNFRSL